MKIPADRKIRETRLSVMWMDDDGILCSVARENVPLTIEGLQEVYIVVRDLAQGKMICSLTEMSGISPSDKETRDYAKKEMETFTKAMALLGQSKISAVIANLFIGFQNPSFPTKVFTDHKEARKWLKQYL